MTISRWLARALPVAASVALLALPAGASGQDMGGRPNALPMSSGGKGFTEGLMLGRTAAFAANEQASGENYLPPVRQNVDLVSRLELTQPFGDVTPDEIADVAVHKGAAYLAGWSEGKFNEPCTRGGVFSVDITDPAHPKQLAFRSALPQNYHGEGMHAISVNTPAYTGDLLAVNNETCTANTTPTNANVPAGGGFDLYDVSNPADPKVLSRANGDYGGEGTLVGTDRIAHESHSIFLWQDGNRAFAVIVDNEEDHDVDIFDVSNPRAVTPVGEFDFDEMFPQIKEDDEGQGNFASNNLHDMVVKNINGTQTMLASYWDSGYVTLNVSNPAAPAYIGDSDFGASDPLTGFSPPEGNGHQAEFSHDNKYILAADEDFDQYRFQAELKDGPNAGFQFHEAGGADKGTFITPENPVEDEDSRFVGDACTASGPLAAPSPGVTIAVVERGTCTFQEKAQNADDAGYDTILIFNNRGTDGQRCDVLLGMTLGTYSGDILALFVARSVGMRIIGAYDPATYSCDGTAGTGTPAPAAPQEGATLDIAVLFDGWGYSHLYRNQAGKLPKLGDYAINEGVDPRWAERFGDLSIHEFAADPATNLAYISYYSGGFRVVRYGESGIEQVGAFVDQRPDGKGNDFWGVEQFTAANGERLIATSDRDYGLYIFRYTGPGAIGPTPVKPGLLPGRCTNALVGTAGGEKIVGTAAGDIITGYAGDDEIEGAGGDDCINGLEGNDLLRGGSGVDTVDGHKGNDRVYGGSGRGTLRGGTGRDRLFGSTLRDTLFGNTGADRLAGGRGADQLFGGAGPDRIVGGRGRDTIEGGTGNDRIYAKDGRRDFIDCGFGNDRVVTRDAVDRTTSCERRG